MSTQAKADELATLVPLNEVDAASREQLCAYAHSDTLAADTLVVTDPARESIYALKGTVIPRGADDLPQAPVSAPEWHGEPNDRLPVVFIRGTGAAGNRWLPQVEAYVPTYRCMFFDNRGSGASDAPPGAYTVEQMTDWFAAHDKVWLGITPEGTRRKTGVFKKGYLHIAKAANVPVSIVGVDGATKRVVLNEIWPLTGDIDADNDAIKAHCDANYSGVRPEKK